MKDHTGETHGDFLVIKLRKRYALSSATWDCVCTLCGKKKVLKTSELNDNPAHSPLACLAKTPQKKTAEAKDYTKIPGCKHGCKHYRYFQSFSGRKCCHYILDTGARRPRDENGCCTGYEARL